MIGLDWNGSAQRALCSRVFANQKRLRFAVEPTADRREFHTRNNWFPALDAWVLEAMLRHLRPTRLVEVGSGLSTLVTARVNRELFGHAMHVTCVDPFPPAVVAQGLDGIDDVRAQSIQDVSLDVSVSLKQNDVLFIDTSHTVKTGGDVTWMFEEIIPRLRTGVVVHLHDIFLPSDYPPNWVLGGRGWNEQYLVRAFVALNKAFQVLFSVAWMRLHAGDLLLRAFPGLASSEHATLAGGSLWIRRID
jgi:hypothetical protein